MIGDQAVTRCDEVLTPRRNEQSKIVFVRRTSESRPLRNYEVGREPVTVVRTPRDNAEVPACIIKSAKMDDLSGGRMKWIIVRCTRKDVDRECSARIWQSVV